MAKLEQAHTLMRGQTTLFVTGVPDLERVQIEMLNKGASHVHFGCNNSFAPDGTAQYWKPWDEVILHLLKNEVWVTLEFDVANAEEILESGYTEWDTFIPLIQVKLPYIEQYGYNTTIKIHDTRSDNTWYHDLQDLLPRDRFLHRSRVDRSANIEYNSGNES